jgi:hypothetical protein
MTLMALIIAIDVVAWLDITSFSLGSLCQRLAESALEMPGEDEVPQRCDQRRMDETTVT